MSRGGTITGGGERVREVKRVRVVNNNSTTVATAITPTSGKRIKIISVNVAFEATTANGLEIYFGTGTNIGSNAGKEIAEAHQAAKGPVFEAWFGESAMGAVDEVVSIRGTDLVAEDVSTIIFYREY